jgi:outer membrane protein assembly factor BamB
MGVNATGCVPKVLHGPERDPAAWSLPLGTTSRAPSADDSVPAEPALWWRASIGRATSGPPAVGNAVLAFATLDRTLRLLRWEDGETIWRRALSAPTTGGPLIAEDRVYVATAGRDGRLYAFRLEDGRQVWNKKLGPVIGPIATVGGRVLAATEDGRVVAAGVTRGSTRWERRLPGRVRSGVALVGEDLFVATDDSVYLLSAEDGSVRAHGRAPGTIRTPPAWVGDTLVVTSPDGLVAGLSRADLVVLWSVRTADPIFGGPAIARDTVFAISLGGTLWRIPLRDPDGATSARLGVTVRATPAPVANGVLLGTVAGEVLLESDDGTVTRKARIEGPIEEPPIMHDGAMLVIDGKGRVYAWR